MIDELISQLTVSAGEEYHKLHSGKQEFKLTDSRMKYYEKEALTAIYEIGLEAIGAAEEPKHQPFSKMIAEEGDKIIRNQLRAAQRKAWAKACGVAEK